MRLAFYAQRHRINFPSLERRDMTEANPADGKLREKHCVHLLNTLP